MNTHELIQARLNDPLAPILAGDAQAIPDEIQWMPPGAHTITPHVDGKPRELSLVVDEGLAAALAPMVERMRTAAAEGNGDMPYLDFNHEDGPAAAEVIGLRWAGADPKAGGIRVRVKWTKAGREALEGRTYRRFSPQWFTDPKTGLPAGVGVNLGGLVNRAAFQTIQPVVAKDAAAQPEKPMTEAEKNEFRELLTSATKPLTDRIAALETKASAGPDLSGVTNRLKALEEAGDAGRLTSAKARVQQLAAEGRIAPQDAAGLESLAKAGAADPTVLDCLAKQPVNPAFQKMTASSGSAGGGGTQPENFAKAVEAEKTAGAKTTAAAVDLAMGKFPDLYREWVKTGGKL